jgi:dTDP-glucose pyrophosphorylase/predicted transcriptional regulator
MGERFEQALVRDDAALRDAMRSLELSGTQIVLVVDSRGQLRGTITDGDIRRGLLAGASLDALVSEFLNASFFAVPAGTARADVLELMQARQVAQIPEIDDRNVVVGLHLLNELIAAVERPNVAVLMAGGRGTRLGPLTDTIPKPMLPVAGRPILERLVLQLVSSGIRRIYLSVNYRAELIEAHFGNGHRFGCTVEYLREPEALGTAGSLALLPPTAEVREHPLVVMNGDLMTQTNVGRLLDFHDAGTQAISLAVRRHVEQLPFGNVEVEGDLVVGFTEKPTTTRLINAGIYVLDPACLDSLEGVQHLTMPELIERVRRHGREVRVLEIDDEWIDVGRPVELSRARHGE